MEYLPIDKVTSNKFVFYIKKERNKDRIHLNYLNGFQGENDNTIHRNVGLNLFEQKPVPIPKGYEKIKTPDRDWVKQNFWNPKAKYVQLEKVPEYEQTYYYIHDNGFRPFIVYLSDKNVATVYKIPSYEDDYYYNDELYDNVQTRRQLYTKKVYQTKYKRVFIGQSPRDKFTEFGKGYGHDFDGNSILLQLYDLEYVHIYNRIEKFNTCSPIVKYQSSVGNNDVPYPYAIDKDGRYYMLLDNVIMEEECCEHPYYVYYEKIKICAHDCVNFKNKSYKDYVGFYIDDESYLLRWNTEYNRSDRLYVLKADGDKYILTEDEYTNLMNEYGKDQKLRKYNTTLIHKRII